MKKNSFWNLLSLVVFIVCTLSVSVTATQIDPLPAWAYGTFNGYIDGGVNSGTATMTVTSLGKITGKLVLWGKSYAFSAASYAAGGSPTDGFSVTVNPGKQFMPLTFRVTKSSPESMPQMQLGVATGKLNDSWLGYCLSNHNCEDIRDLPVTMYRDVWKEAGTSPIGYYTATLPGIVGEYGSGYLTFTVDAAGKFKTVGKLADGTALSPSGTLILDETGCVFAVIYTSPAAYKGGCLFGLVEFVTPVVTEGEIPLVFLRLPDKVKFNWNSLNYLATKDYASGFLRTPGLSGGWYDKLKGLQTYYTKLSVGNMTGAPIITATVTTTYWGSDDNGNDRKFTERVPTDVEATCWNPGGLVLTVTENGLVPLNKPETPKKDPGTGEYNYDLGNATGLTISLMRATGIFRGSFNVYYDYISADNSTLDVPTQTYSHVVKKASYEGVLLSPERDPADGIPGAGRGFYLWPGKSTYEKVDKFGEPLVDKNGNPILIPYSFNVSYDFLINE